MGRGGLGRLTGFALAALALSMVLPWAPPARAIIRGEVAASGVWRWHAELGLGQPGGKPEALCGAALIAPQWALTAAHCVAKRKRRPLEVGYGSNRLSGLSWTRVAEVIFPPGWRDENLDNDKLDYDIALLRLAEPTVAPGLGSKVAYVGLPWTMAANTPAPTTAVLTGFGVTAHCPLHGNLSDCSKQEQMRQVELPVVETGTCGEAYRHRGQVIGERQICAGPASGGRASCRGDSGGPLVRETADGRWVQIGVVSWSESCSQTGQPTVYTRVSAFQDWLTSHVGPPPDAP